MFCHYCIHILFPALPVELALCAQYLALGLTTTLPHFLKSGCRYNCQRFCYQCCCHHYQCCCRRDQYCRHGYQCCCHRYQCCYDRYQNSWFFNFGLDKGLMALLVLLSKLSDNLLSPAANTSDGILLCCPLHENNITFELWSLFLYSSRNSHVDFRFFWSLLG